MSSFPNCTQDCQNCSFHSQAQALVLGKLMYAQPACVTGLQVTETEALCHSDFHRKPCTVRQPHFLYHAKRILDSKAL